MEKKDSKHLNDFLKKVDDVTSIIAELNAGNDNAVNKADTFLDNITGEKRSNDNGFSKTHINKIQDKPHAETREQISPEEFMKKVGSSF